MNIIKRELRANFKALIIWIASISTIVYFASLEFSVFNGDPTIVEAMEQFEYLFNILGVSVANITKPEGYLSVMSLYLFLPLSIYAALLGSSIISKEERDKTAEYLFTLPISREKVLLGKLTAAIIYVFVSALLICLVCLAFFSRYSLNSDLFNFIVYLGIGLIILELVFMSIGMMLASVLRQYKRSGAITLGYLMSAFMLSMLMGMTDKLDFLKYFTPFQYFPVQELLDSEISVGFSMLSAGIFVACITSVFIFFKKRDLYI